MIAPKEPGDWLTSWWIVTSKSTYLAKRKIRWGLEPPPPVILTGCWVPDNRVIGREKVALQMKTLDWFCTVSCKYALGIATWFLRMKIY